MQELEQGDESGAPYKSLTLCFNSFNSHTVFFSQKFDWLQLVFVDWGNYARMILKSLCMHCLAWALTVITQSESPTQNSQGRVVGESLQGKNKLDLGKQSCLSCMQFSCSALLRSVTERMHYLKERVSLKASSGTCNGKNTGNSY